MSALTDRIAAKHRDALYINTADAIACKGCGEIIFDTAHHIAEVTEAAVAPHIAAQVASDIHGQFGVNVSDETSDWWDGYRQAQRDVLRKLQEIEACYRIEADHG